MKHLITAAVLVACLVGASVFRGVSTSVRNQTSWFTALESRSSAT
jgi:hypothetical protein